MFRTAVGLLMPKSDLPTEFSLPDTDAAGLESGGSAIIAPDARYIIQPVFEREELIVADPNLAELDKESMTSEVTGHYSRPDIFRLELKEP